MTPTRRRRATNKLRAKGSVFVAGRDGKPKPVTAQFAKAKRPHLEGRTP